MLLLILAIVLVSLGIICAIIYDKNYSDGCLVLGCTCLIVGVSSLLAMIIILSSKPLEYTNFKIKYDTLKNMITDKDDIRDATFTNNLLEINKDILTCRAYINSNWIGVFYNKNICDAELLSKDVDNDTINKNSKGE